MTFDVASSLAVFGGATSMDGTVSRVAAWWTTRTRYFGAISMTYSDTVRSITNVCIRPSRITLAGVCSRIL